EREQSRRPSQPYPEQRQPRPARYARPEPIILPGESLAKFNRRPESERAQPKSQESSEAQPESRFQVAPRRPSTEVTQPASLISASHGILAGESLAKYRQKPAAESSEAKVSTAPPQPEEARSENLERHDFAAPAVTDEPESQQERRDEQTSARHREAIQPE